MCPIINISFRKVNTSLLDYSRKKTGEVEDMEFPRVLKKEQVDFPGAN